MLTIEEFIKKLSVEFEGYEVGEISPESSFRNLKNWSSVHALILMAFVESEFGVSLDVEDLTSSETVSDIYERILNKLNK